MRRDDGDADRRDRGRRHPETGSRYAPVRNADEGRVRIIPSIPMLTTPERSHMTPHRAA